MKNGMWILSAKRFLGHACTFLVFLSPALIGVIPGKLWIFYVLLCLVFTVLRVVELKLFVGMLCVCLLLADLMLRFFGAGLIYPRPEDRYTNRWPKLPSLSRFQPNVRYEGDVYGDLSGLVGNPLYQEKRHVRFVTDAFGFRNSPESTDKPYDLIVVGDSVGAGMNASQESIWPEQLKSAYGHAVYNLSTGGCPWDYFMNIQSEIGRLKTNPRTQILFVISASNDLFGHYASTNPSYESVWAQKRIAYETFRNRSPVKLIVGRFAYLLKSNRKTPDSVVVKDFINGKKMLFLKEFFDHQKHSNEDVLKHENIAQLTHVLNQLGKLSREHKVGVTVIMVPPKEDVYSWVYKGADAWTSDRFVTGFSQVIQKICTSEGFSYWDAKPFLIDESKRVFEQSGGTLWWYDDSHWNGAGHAAFARGIQEQVINKAA